MSFIAVKQNFEVFIGGTFTYPFEWAKKEEKENVPENLEEFNAIMPIVGSNSKTPWKILKNENAKSNIRLYGKSGVIEPFISNEDTLIIPWKRATYELILINTITKISYPLLEGELFAKSGVPPGTLKEL